MIEALEWRGGRDGDLLLIHVDSQTGERQPIAVDRPGDLIAKILELGIRSEALLASAARYGCCLGGRSIDEDLFLREIVRKTAAFLLSADGASLVLRRELDAFQAFANGVTERGAAFRDELLAAAHRLAGTPS